MGNKSLADLLSITELEANVFIHTFYLAYPKIKPFKKSVIEFCIKNGFVETLMKKRRYLPLINSTVQSEQGLQYFRIFLNLYINIYVRVILLLAQAERQAVHTMIQGSAADIVKSKLFLLYEIIKRDLKKVDIKLMLLLHDEFIFEIPAEKIDEFKNSLIVCMEDNQNLSVPLPVQIKVGKKWGDLERL